ncbi:MAG: BREX-1 system phosphatase PglZ type A [Lachnospiraceae bacterium]|nr:BREX-1 system phosphatase PglZ type A [Lachnospiraceae bacterium]
MDSKEIAKQLLPMFTEDTPIVFWDDDGGEFEEALGSLPLAENGITLVRREEFADLELKVRLILEAKPEERFLLYSKQAVPSPEKDWLLDVRLYSREFHADAEALILLELGLSEKLYLRPHIKERRKFFASKERITKLKKLITPDIEQDELDMAMVAVTAKTESISFFALLTRVLIDAYTNGTDEKTLWNELERYGLTSLLRRKVKAEFGYPTAEGENFSPQGLLRCLLVTEMAADIEADLPDAIAHFNLGQAYALNAALFCREWRNNLSVYKDYIEISANIARELKLEEKCAPIAAKLSKCVTFECLERLIVADIVKKIGKDPLDTLRARIRERRSLFWTEWEIDGIRPYKETYTGLAAMLDIRVLREKYAAGFHFATFEEIISAYTKELFRFDQCYRHFCLAHARVSLHFDVLKHAGDMVEEWITNEYCRNLAQSWEGFLPGENGALAQWNAHVGRPISQCHFYSTFPGDTKRNSRVRPYVIISDALRYEIAEELCHAINGDERFNASLDAQLGCLPSITRIGMANLLPHQKLTFDQDTNVLVDGMPSSNLENRNAILSKYGGMALSSDKLKGMKQEEARELIRDAKMVYIYHDSIDSTGDHDASEGQTFAAAETAIKDLVGLVRFIINKLNGGLVFITSDHGFLYQHSKPGCTDKAEQLEQPGAIRAKKRYVLGHSLTQVSSAWHGFTRATAAVDDDEHMEFLVPKGTGRFHFKGGARYTHGGAMPQEVIVPVVTVKELTGKKKLEVKEVDVQFLGNSPIRITSNIAHFQFCQMEKISERCKPLTLEFFLADGSTPISEVQTVAFDSTSESMDDRIKSFSLLLKNQTFDPDKKYKLIAYIKEKRIEYFSAEVSIDILIPNLF